MTRRKFRFFMVTFVIVSISILAGFVVQNFKSNRDSKSANPLQETIVNESMSDGSTNSALNIENLDFFINESAVKKTKTSSNEVTTFTIETKLFITNNGNKTVNIDPDAFKVTYDTDGSGLLFSTEYGNIEKPVILDVSQTTAINFVVKYVIHDTERFNDNIKRELKFNYIDKQILVCLV